ncbi:hypothetical protein CHUAL_007864 [Chamberlinius hualienensis]
MVKVGLLKNKQKTIRRPIGMPNMAVHGGVILTKRRFLPRPRPTVSVVVTVTFVAIFTIIITMEVILMDEARRKVSMTVTDELPNVRESGNWVERDTAEINLLQKQLSLGLPLDLTEKEWASTNYDKQEIGVNSHLLNSLNPPSTIADNQKQLSNSGKWFISTNQSVTPDDWQPVLGGKEKFYVYSAFLDSRRGSYIRVIGATRTRSSEKVQCIFWYHDSNTPSIKVGGTIKVIRENWNLKYSAVFVLCPIDSHSRPSMSMANASGKRPVPDEVSVVVVTSSHHSTTNNNNNNNRNRSKNRQTTEIGNRLPVLNKNYTQNPSWNSSSIENGGFAVCVKPLHYDFNRAVQLIEFIELNRILGVSHFTFYNHTIGHETACALKHYIQEGVVTLLPWQLDMISQKEIRTEGLFAAINDCLYRYMYRYRYLVMIDIDEFIVPHRNFTLGSMVHEFQKKIDPQKAGSFSFMNSFFYLQWPNDPNSKDLQVPLITLQKTKRRAKLHPHKQRSKCIIVPSYVVEMGNHFVWEFIVGKGSINVPPEIAFLHHYRICEFGGNDCVKTQSVTDRTLYRYKTSLVQRVLDRVNSTSQVYQQSNYVYMDAGQNQYQGDCKGINTTNLLYNS